MNRLRSENWKTSWLGVITALLFLLFFVGGPDVDSSRSFKNFWNVGHFAFFALFIRLLVVDGPLGAGTTFYKQLVLSVLLGRGLVRRFAFREMEREEVDIAGCLPLRLGSRLPLALCDSFAKGRTGCCSRPFTQDFAAAGS